MDMSNEPLMISYQFSIPDNSQQLYRTSYAVRSAITATAELLVCMLIHFRVCSCPYLQSPMVLYANYQIAIQRNLL